MYMASKGVITSPKYPYNYPDNAACIYTISLPVGTRIHMTMLSMDIEYNFLVAGEESLFDADTYDGNVETCMFDHLRIHDGNSSLSPRLAEYCGDARLYTDLLVVDSTQNHVWMRWDIDIFHGPLE